MSTRTLRIPRPYTPTVPHLTHAQTRLLARLLSGPPLPWLDCEVFDTRALELAGLITHDRATDLVSVTAAGRRYLEDAP